METKFLKLLKHCSNTIKGNLLLWRGSKIFSFQYSIFLLAIFNISTFNIPIPIRANKSQLTRPTGNKAVASLIIGGGGGVIFIYLCSAQLISFEINCFYAV